MTVRESTAPDDDAMRYGGWRKDVRGFLHDEITRSGLPGPLPEAIRYGSTAPEASRWRALLVMEAGRVLGVPSRALLPAAAAVEAPMSRVMAANPRAT